MIELGIRDIVELRDGTRSILGRNASDTIILRNFDENRLMLRAYIALSEYDENLKHKDTGNDIMKVWQNVEIKLPLDYVDDEPAWERDEWDDIPAGTLVWVWDSIHGADKKLRHFMGIDKKSVYRYEVASNQLADRGVTTGWKHCELATIESLEKYIHKV